MPAPHNSAFYSRPDAVPAAQPTAPKHWKGKGKGKGRVHDIALFT